MNFSKPKFVNLLNLDIMNLKSLPCWKLHDWTNCAPDADGDGALNFRGSPGFMEARNLLYEKENNMRSRNFTSNNG